MGCTTNRIMTSSYERQAFEANHNHNRNHNTKFKPKPNTQLLIQTMNSNDPRNAEFQAGVTAAMRRWTGLRAAVEGEWGGPQSGQIAEDLRTNILEKFVIPVGADASKMKLPMEVEDLEDAISEYMEEEFSCLLEDDSPKHLASIVVEMFGACATGNFKLSQDMVAAAQREESSRVNEKVVVKDAEDGDDDMMDDGDKMTNAVTIQSTSAVSYASESLFGEDSKKKYDNDLPAPRQLGEVPLNEIMEEDMDEDGFAPVRRSRRNNKGRRPGVNC